MVELSKPAFSFPTKTIQIIEAGDMMGLKRMEQLFDPLRVANDFPLDLFWHYEIP